MNLNGATFSAVVDSVGKWHNDYQKNLLSSMQAKNITLSTDTLQSFLKNWTISFLATKGITPQNTVVSNFDLSDTTWETASYSIQAKAIYSNLKSLVNNYNESKHSYFVSQCNNLKIQALNLPIDTEALSVGSSVSIAINSFTYWKENAASWQYYLEPSISVSSNTLYYQAAANPINLKQLGGTDIKGAISGAVSGALGAGPAGAAAGGILGSAVSSSFNILSQAAQNMPGTLGVHQDGLLNGFNCL